MKDKINDIVLRPRFTFDVEAKNETLLEGFEAQKLKQKDFIVTRLDDHVFIKFPKNVQHYWSPQLHLEINTKNNATNTATVHGLFGPSPTVWTFFMFLHFLVGGMFIAFAIWAFTNMTLKNEYAVQVFLTLLAVVFWFLLYFIGRIGKAKGQPEMHQLHAFMRDTLRDYR